MTISLLIVKSQIILTQLIAISLSVPIHDRIVGGDNVTIEEYPYQVSVQLFDHHYCGGSILNKLYILTAAHCFENQPVERINVRAGSSIRDEGGIIIQVIRKFIHPEYNNTTNDNDICILKLKHPLSFNKKIASIQLPKQNTRNDSVDYMMGVATGWGMLESNGVYPKQLQMVKLPTWTQDECKRVMSMDTSTITDRMFCAGYHEGGKDTCQGDSGGPIAAEGKVIGVTSFGDFCADEESPGVYVRVSYFVDYINSIISN